MVAREPVISHPPCCQGCWGQVALITSATTFPSATTARPSAPPTGNRWPAQLRERPCATATTAAATTAPAAPPDQTRALRNRLLLLLLLLSLRAPSSPLLSACRCRPAFGLWPPTTAPAAAAEHCLAALLELLPLLPLWQPPVLLGSACAASSSASSIPEGACVPRLLLAANSCTWPCSCSTFCSSSVF